MELIIDAHQHFWKYNKREYPWINDQMEILKKNYLPGHLSSLMTEEKIIGSVAVQARQSIEETEWLLQLADEYEFVKGVVGWVDLCSKNLTDQLDKYASNQKLVGVRHVIHDEPDDFYILRNDFNRGIEELKKYNLTYDILIFEHHLPQTIEFVKKHPNQIFIVDHIAKPKIRQGNLHPWKTNIEKLAGFQNVFCKLSGIITEADWKNWNDETIKPYLDVVVDAFGTNRVMIGSDWPVCLVAGSYKQVIELTTDYFTKFSENEKGAVFGNNALNIYQMI
ncbi:MAG: amidohydrolase family protein [Bacteroidales bacterium]|nr:amidohydrolase family protein [Bacteroidales bacterium]